MSLVEVRDLSVAFGSKRVVDGVSFSLERGETLALVGESGSGKSLTALSLLQLLPAGGTNPAGQVTLDGQEIMGADAATLHRVRGDLAGIVFQEPMTSLNPLHRIVMQISEAITLHRQLPAEAVRARVIGALAQAGFADAESRLDAFPHQLSGGQRQRVMIAMALANDPALLIADEPTTALDVTIQAQILELMKDLTQRLNIALIVITHNLGVVARYATRVNVMYAGRIVESGSAAAIYHDPRHPYTIALLRSVPRLDRPRQARLDPVEGQPPDLTRLDAGCAFRPRCRFATDACAAGRPVLAQAGLEDGHLAACFNSGSLSHTDQAA